MTAPLRTARYVMIGGFLGVVTKTGAIDAGIARVITGLLPPSQGRIEFAGRTLSPDLPTRSREDLRELQMIYQMPDTALNPRQTVRKVIGRPTITQNATFTRRNSDSTTNTSKAPMNMLSNISSRRPSR